MWSRIHLPVQETQEMQVEEDQPGSRRSPRVGNGIRLQYSCLEKNLMDRGACRATVHSITNRVGHN